MAQRIQFRRDTTANWEATNPIPATGEPCFDIDLEILKIGDGITQYGSLPITGSGEGGGGSGIIVNDSVTNAKLANMAQNTVKGRSTSATGDPEDLTPAQVRALLATDAGSSPTTKFINGVGAWAVPVGSPGATGPAGSTGPAGGPGPAGPGVPAAGTIGQLLAKTSGTDYDTQWVDPGVPLTRTITTTAPLSGGGALSGNLTLAVAQFSAGGATPGVVPGANGVGATYYLNATGAWTQVVTAADITSAVNALKALVYGSVVHGSNAATARPSGFAGIVWFGSVQPSNAVAPDVIVRTDEAV